MEGPVALHADFCFKEVRENRARSEIAIRAAQQKDALQESTLIIEDLNAAAMQNHGGSGNAVRNNHLAEPRDHLRAGPEGAESAANGFSL